MSDKKRPDMSDKAETSNQNNGSDDIMSDISGSSDITGPNELFLYAIAV